MPTWLTEIDPFEALRWGAGLLFLIALATFFLRLAGRDLGDMAGAWRGSSREEKYARLLVTEILLYNRDEIDEGRRRGDLGERMATEIDRARQRYEKDVERDRGEPGDHFDHAVVEILAEGDPSLL